MGLGGMVVMLGAPDMTAEAGMGLLSRSTLGLEGSSAVKTGISSRIFKSCIGKMERLCLPIVIYPGNSRTKLLLLIRKCCCVFIKVQTGRLIMVNVASLQRGGRYCTWRESSAG